MLVNVLKDIGPLYHSFSFFGINNKQMSSKHKLNQKAKAPILIAYIAEAIAKSSNGKMPVSFTELFCGAGFYSMVASRLGCSSCYGVDKKAKNIKKARVIASKLGIKNVVFEEKTITPESEFPQSDIVANIGGLYHVDAPEKFLELSYRMAKRYLIIQSVVSLATNDENYYESPAPHWTWGNRFSKESFDKMIKRHSFDVIDYHFNELEGNTPAEDRGSVYYLVKK